jgi:hypothetical protein
MAGLAFQRKRTPLLLPALALLGALALWPATAEARQTFKVDIAGVQHGNWSGHYEYGRESGGCRTVEDLGGFAHWEFASAKAEKFEFPTTFGNEDPIVSVRVVAPLDVEMTFTQTRAVSGTDESLDPPQPCTDTSEPFEDDCGRRQLRGVFTLYFFENPETGEPAHNRVFLRGGPELGDSEFETCPTGLFTGPFLHQTGGAKLHVSSLLNRRHDVLETTRKLDEPPQTVQDDPADGTGSLSSQNRVRWKIALERVKKPPKPPCPVDDCRDPLGLQSSLLSP